MPYTNHFTTINNKALEKFWGRLPLQDAACLLNFYNYSNVKWMLHRLKYEGRMDIGFIIGEMIGKRMVSSNRFKDIDIIIPVPLHKDKLVLRGYNQAECIAKGIGEILQKKVESSLLFKISHTVSQTKMGRFDRIMNVSDSFNVVDKTRYQGRHILIVDDVITTGATLEACALKLFEIPSIKVSITAACLARH